MTTKNVYGFNDRNTAQKLKNRTSIPQPHLRPNIQLPFMTRKAGFEAAIKFLKMYIAVITEAVPVATSSGPGKGKARRQKINDSDQYEYIDNAEEAVDVFSVDEVTGTAVDRRVLIAQDAFGKYLLIVEVCPAV